MKNILTVNHGLCKSIINTLPQQYLSDNWESKYNTYTKYCNAPKFYYDRTNTIPHYLNVKQDYCPIPDSSNFNYTFNEVVENRAKELLSIGKPINVCWSGGLDSTFVALMLNHYAVDKDQVKIYGTYNSVIESGYFFDKVIKPRFKYTIQAGKPYNEFFENSSEIYVTGSPSNDLFYKELTLSYYLDVWIKFKDNFNINNSFDSDYTKVLDEDIIHFFDNFIKKSPKKLETVQDLRWWFSFSFNWYSTILSEHREIGLDKSKQIYPFFGTDDFQRWSITNKEPTKSGDYLDDRWQIREAIQYYSGDSFYSKNKKNFASNLYNLGNKWLFTLDDYSNIYLDDLQNPTSVSYK
jgi:hypothetical protein